MTSNYRIKLLRRKRSQTEVVYNSKYAVYISFSKNNIRLNIIDLINGSVLFWTTPSKEGFKRKQKLTSLAVSKMIDSTFLFLSTCGILTVECIFKRFYRFAEDIAYGLHKKGIVITTLIDKTPVPFGGCRPRARRSRR